VLTKQARYEDAIATYAYIQTRWPNDPENPTYQFRIAQLNMSLPIPIPTRPTKRSRSSTSSTKEGTTWRVANRNDPDALATADRYIEESLASVATNYHVHAQQTGSVGGLREGAELYAQYLKTFPFSDNYYEITWYLADTLAKSGKPEEATKLYEVLANAEGSPYRDGARYELMLARRQILVQKYGKEDALPPDAKIERTVTLPSGKQRNIYELGPDHKAFIELADALANTDAHRRAREDARGEPSRHRVHLRTDPLRARPLRRGPPALRGDHPALAGARRSRVRREPRARLVPGGRGSRDAQAQGGALLGHGARPVEGRGREEAGLPVDRGRRHLQARDGSHQERQPRRGRPMRSSRS
jgi:hypothetical protein